MKSLVIGMGIGLLYKTVLTELGHEVVTVDMDPAKGADYYDYATAYKDHIYFDTVHICTPNHTHASLARDAGNRDAKLVFVEKPGVENHYVWASLIRDCPNTRFMMVKNNQLRDEIPKFKDLADKSERVWVRWNNANRIPHPGSWFTTKDKSFGGVSRDLIPHMLSYYCILTDYNKGVKLFAKAMQHYELNDIHSTDYGSVNPNGTYNVDDFCEIEFKNRNTTWILTANWRTNLDHDDSSISFCLNGSAIRYELGLCPESAYKKMIKEAVQNLNNVEYWKEQQAQDIWIHKQIEKL